MLKLHFCFLFYMLSVTLNFPKWPLSTSPSPNKTLFVCDDMSSDRQTQRPRNFFREADVHVNASLNSIVSFQPQCILIIKKKNSNCLWLYWAIKATFYCNNTCITDDILKVFMVFEIVIATMLKLGKSL